MTTREIAERLGARRQGEGWSLVKCPAHDDRTPSLRISASRNGGTIVFCHGKQCDEADFMEAIKLEREDLFPDREPSWSAGGGPPRAPRVALLPELAKIARKYKRHGRELDSYARTADLLGLAWLATEIRRMKGGPV